MSFSISTLALIFPFVVYVVASFFEKYVFTEFVIKPSSLSPSCITYFPNPCFSESNKSVHKNIYANIPPATIKTVSITIIVIIIPFFFI